MFKSIYDINFLDMKALVRVDFNVPFDGNRKITDDSRIKESLTTVDKIIDDGGIPVLMSHLGRPKDAPDPKYSLQPVAEHLRNKWGYKVIFAEDCIGAPAESAVAKAAVGEIVLLENLRFHKEEKKNDPEFAAKLAKLGDIYVNDAFGSAHRAHASTEAVAKLMPERVAGALMIDEIEYLKKTVEHPQKPFVAILGGAKISGKIDVIRNLMDKCDSILVGGGMMYTFFKAMGLEIGKSLLEEDRIEEARQILEIAKSKNVKLILPTDTIIADTFANDSPSSVVSTSSIPNDKIGMDIGPATINLFGDEIAKARTVVWNGPMGVFELPNFAAGTLGIAQALADATAKGAITIVGGGDSAAAINQMNFKKKVTHVSTGGGASLEFLEGKVLPGIAALEY